MLNTYQHLGLDERRDIYRQVKTGRSVKLQMHWGVILRRSSARSPFYYRLPGSLPLPAWSPFFGEGPGAFAGVGRSHDDRSFPLVRHPEIVVGGDLSLHDTLGDSLARLDRQWRIGGNLSRHGQRRGHEVCQRHDMVRKA